jgi:multimeric flavodoxin WrbA
MKFVTRACQENAMKILICMGSYRKGGNTDRVVGLIKAHLQAEADRHHTVLELETLYLGHLAITPCRGCRACFDRGEDKCPLKDDLPAVTRKMQQADGILVATPVYVDDVSGIVKNWMDRLAYVCHRPEFAGKCAYLVATVGSSPTGRTLDTLNLAFSTWGFYIAGRAGFKMGALLPAGEAQSRYAAQAEKIAREFFQALHQQKSARPSFRALLTFKIQQQFWQKAAHDQLDYRYWHEQGWLDPHQTFYRPHQASALKVALARLTGSVIARFVA